MGETAIKEDVVGRPDLLRSLGGSGIEIGALQNPAHVPHLKVKYVDRLTAEDALKHYPELKGQPLVNVDIIDDAELLQSIADGSQDFVIANHVIEHMRDPIGALLNWARVLRPGGRLFLAVPDCRLTFDKTRAKTTISHLLEDHLSPSPERDFEHFREFALHVSCRTFNVRPEGEADQFARELFEMKYSIHYHVWDSESFGIFILTVRDRFAESFSMDVVQTVSGVENEFIVVLERRS